MSEPKASAGARLAVVYITVGALIALWTAIYYLFYLSGHQAEPGDHRFRRCREYPR